MDFKPIISVVMPVYNGEKYLREAIESILNQTFKDFEFIIIDDGSKDRTLSIINEYKELDDRIVVVSRENKGLIYSLNEGIKLSKGEYIARMDCDDISMPMRFEKQIKFMRNNNQYGLVGTWYCVIDESGNETLKRAFPFCNEEIKLFFSVYDVLAHGSLIIRKDLLFENNYGNIKYKDIEDFELWIRLSHITEIANINEYLYKYRLHANNFCIEKQYECRQQTRILTREYWNENIKQMENYIRKLVNKNDIKYRKKEEKEILNILLFLVLIKTILSKKYKLSLELYRYVLKSYRGHMLLRTVKYTGLYLLLFTITMINKEDLYYTNIAEGSYKLNKFFKA